MHDASGNCKGCEFIFNIYPNFHQQLKEWFKSLQRANPSFHISAGGRGREQQELFFAKGLSKAHYGHSAHNFNAAIDLFQLVNGKVDYSREAFNRIVAPALTEELTWFGSPGASFPELPHIEWKNYRELVASGELTLVEP